MTIWWMPEGLTLDDISKAYKSGLSLDNIIKSFNLNINRRTLTIYLRKTILLFVV